MKYREDEALQEILHRSRILMEKRSVRRFSTAALATAGALVLMVSILSEGGMQLSEISVMGSFLLPAEAGGYVLLAVVAFTAGVVLTMITQRYRRKKQDEEVR